MTACREPQRSSASGASRASLLRHGLIQAQFAQAMGVTPWRVSQIQRGEAATIEAIARYIEALGSRLDLVASFGDHTLTVTTTQAA
jgi:transcriptional regulator with XRE-family HTH domain